MITARYLPATDHKPSRIVVVSKLGKTVTGYSHSERDAFEYAVGKHIQQFNLHRGEYAETEITIGGKVYRVYTPSIRATVKFD